MNIFQTLAPLDIASHFLCADPIVGFMEQHLADKSCVPCKGGIPPLTREEFEPMLKEIDSAWKVIEDKKLSRTFEFSKFTDSVAFVNKVAKIAEKEGHHPDIQIHYTKVIIELWTFKINGLFDNDFILAAKIDQIPL